MTVARHRRPAFGFRAVMLDLGRITERKEYYASLLPYLAEWGYNVVHLHLADDQCCALRFPSRPELATSGAFTAEEMREFIRAARRHGLGVMPEIESLGHSRFITEHPRYRHLAERGLADKGFNSLCPSHPESRALLRDVLRDTAAIFDYPLIHVGLDEVAFGACRKCAKAYGKNVPDWKRFADHAVWVHEEVRRAGRRPAMWGDHVVKSEEMRKTFRRDVVMFHWDYNPQFQIHKAGRLLEAGFEVVCCPATVCWFSRLTAVEDNLANLRQTAARSVAVRKRGLRGMDNTVWCPWRYLPGTIDFGLALGGHVMTEGVERAGFPARFARSFYGASGDAAAAIGWSLTELSAMVFDHPMMTRIAFGADMLPAAFSREDQRQCSLRIPRAVRLAATLKKMRSAVRDNRSRYDDVVIAAETVLAVIRYGASGRRRSAVPGVGALLKRALKAWDRDRRTDDANKFGDMRHFGNDGFLAILAELAGQKLRCA